MLVHEATISLVAGFQRAHKLFEEDLELGLGFFFWAVDGLHCQLLIQGLGDLLPLVHDPVLGELSSTTVVSDVSGEEEGSLSPRDALLHATGKLEPLEFLVVVEGADLVLLGELLLAGVAVQDLLSLVSHGCGLELQLLDLSFQVLDVGLRLGKSFGEAGNVKELWPRTASAIALEELLLVVALRLSFEVFLVSGDASTDRSFSRLGS